MAEGRVENVLLLLEHPPVLTLGRNAKRANVLASDELLARRGVTLHEINRGGDVTYHGPGQLVGYPIFDLRSLQNAERRPDGSGGFCARDGRGADPAVRRVWRAGRDGLRADGGVVRVIRGSDQGSGISWTEKTRTIRLRGPERKIGAIGIHVARGITSHGFAFNVTTDLRDFELIVPCGIPDHAVTSLERKWRSRRTCPGLEAMAHQAARQFGQVFGQQVLAVESLEALRFEPRRRPQPEPNFRQKIRRCRFRPRWSGSGTKRTVRFRLNRLRKNSIIGAL